MEESSPLDNAEVNVFYQFDVHITGESVPGGVATFDGYYCLLSPCNGEKIVFTTKGALTKHRLHSHSLLSSWPNKIPRVEHIRQWLRSGKPLPYQISPKANLVSKLQHCKPEYSESELQPASLKSSIFDQFTVRHKPGEAGEEPYAEFVCLLSQCHEEKRCFNTYPKWTRHRRSVHKETVEAQTITVPDVYEIREWVNQNKPRPYHVPVKRKAWKKEKLCQVDPAVFAEFDVTEDNEKLQFLCLLDPCKEQGVSFQGRRRWKKHRVLYHMFPKYEDGEYSLPSKEIVRNWMNLGKPHHYEPTKRVRAYVDIDPPSAETNIQLHNLEEDPTSTEVGNELNGEKSQNPEDQECRELCWSGNQHSQGHHQGLQHESLSLEDRPSLRGTKSLARLGKSSTFSAPVEIPSESPRRRPRSADEAGGSSESEPAHHKRKKLHSSIHSADSTDSDDGDSCDVVAFRVVAPGEDPSEGLWKQSREETNTTRDETPGAPFDDNDEDCGDKDAHKEIEAPNNVLSSLLEWQNIRLAGQSSVQPQDFQGVMDEHQQNSTAEMGKVGDEGPEGIAALENYLTALQHEKTNLWGGSSVLLQDFQDFQGDVLMETLPNSTAEISSSACMNPELDVTGAAEHGNAQPQNFPSGMLPNTQMGEFNKANEEFINPWDLYPPISCSVSEQAILSSLRDWDGNTFCTTQDSSGENWPNSSTELNLKYSAEMAGFGENQAQEGIAGARNLSLSVQSESSEQSPSSSTLKHYFSNELLFPAENSPGETNNHRPNPGMAEASEEAPVRGYLAPRNIVPRIPLMQSEGTQVPNFEGPMGVPVPPMQGLLPPLSMDQVFHIVTNAAGTAEVREEALEGLVSLQNVEPWIPFTHWEGTEVLSLEDVIRAATIHETVPRVPRVHTDPVFEAPSAAPSAAGTSWVREEYAAAAAGNSVPTLPSNVPQETGEQVFVNINASSQDPRNIQNDSTIHDFPWNSELFDEELAALWYEPVVVPLFNPSPSPLGGRETSSAFGDESAENSTENEVVMTLDVISLTDMDIAFQCALDVPMIDDRAWDNPGEFLNSEAHQPVQQLSSPGSSESSYNWEAEVPPFETDPLIDMNAGLEYELRMRLQADEPLPWWMDD